MNGQMQLYGIAAVAAVTLASYYSEQVMQKFTALQAIIDAVRVTIGG